MFSTTGRGSVRGCTFSGSPTLFATTHNPVLYDVEDILALPRNHLGAEPDRSGDVAVFNRG